MTSSAVSPVSSPNSLSFTTSPSRSPAPRKRPHSAEPTPIPDSSEPQAAVSGSAKGGKQAAKRRRIDSKNQAKNPKANASANGHKPTNVTRGKVASFGTGDPSLFVWGNIEQNFKMQTEDSKRMCQSLQESILESQVFQSQISIPYLKDLLEYSTLHESSTASQDKSDDTDGEQVETKRQRRPADIFEDKFDEDEAREQMNLISEIRKRQKRLLETPENERRAMLPVARMEKSHDSDVENEELQNDGRSDSAVGFFDEEELVFSGNQIPSREYEEDTSLLGRRFDEQSEERNHVEENDGAQQTDGNLDQISWEFLIDWGQAEGEYDFSLKAVRLDFGSLPEGHVDPVSSFHTNNMFSDASAHHIEEHDDFDFDFHEPENGEDTAHTENSHRNPLKINFVPLKRRKRKCLPANQRLRSISLFAPSLQEELEQSLSGDGKEEWGTLVIKLGSNESQIMDTTTLSRAVNHIINDDLAHMNWIARIAWDFQSSVKVQMLSISNDSALDSVLLDMNDDNVLLEEMSSEESEDPLDMTRVSSFHEQAVVNRFNISNDFGPLYRYVSGVAIVGRTDVQHASFALDLVDSIFKPHLELFDLRFFHRPQCTLLLDRRPVVVRLPNPEKFKLSASEYENRKFVPKKENQLFASREGRIVLMEYIEERPPLLSNFGMASEFITYYRRSSEEDEFQAPQVEDGTFRLLAFEGDDDSLFIGEVRPGQTLASLNNNMYAVPVFRHIVPKTDFLLCNSKSRSVWIIREIPALYCVGQIQPKIEVPAPGSRVAGKYMKSRLAVYIYKLLKRDGKVQISTIAEAFKDQSESAIRSELKEVAEFQRGGAQSGWWIRKDTWNAPRDSELQQMVSPEDVCAYESMLSGNQQLVDLGIESLKLSQKLTSIVQRMPEEIKIRELSLYIEEELQLTPWSWTGNFMWAQQGQGFLKLSGPGNPLGWGQGFSYLKAPTRMDPDPHISRIAPAVALTGTDKDLRSLPNDELKDILVSFGVPLPQIEGTQRWDRVNLVREKATDAVMAGIDTPYARFARSTRNTFRAQRKQFKKDAQKIFNRHCEVLAQPDPPSFSEDEERSSADEMDAWARDLEEHLEERETALKMKSETSLGRKRKRKVINEADDEKEYEQLIKRQKQEVEEVKKDIQAPVPNNKKVIKKTRKVLKKITIVLKEDGYHERSEEIIRDPAAVEAYLKDKEDGGTRLQDLFASSSHEKLIAAQNPNRKPRNRMEVKKRRRKKKSEDISPKPSGKIKIVSQINSNRPSLINGPSLKSFAGPKSPSLHTDFKSSRSELEADRPNGSPKRSRSPSRAPPSQVTAFPAPQVPSETMILDSTTFPVGTALATSFPTALPNAIAPGKKKIQVKIKEPKEARVGEPSKEPSKKKAKPKVSGSQSLGQGGSSMAIAIDFKQPATLDAIILDDSSIKKAVTVASSASDQLSGSASALPPLEANKNSGPKKKASATTKKCSACGQVGHAKSNKNCPMKQSQGAGSVDTKPGKGKKSKSIALPPLGELLLPSMGEIPAPVANPAPQVQVNIGGDPAPAPLEIEDQVDATLELDI